MKVREHIDFQRGIDPKKAMGIGFFRYDVDYSGGFEENFEEDKLLAREWIYNGERILEAEGSAGSDHISMWIKLSDGKEFSVEANFTRERTAYLTIPAEDVKDRNVSKEFFEFFYDEDSNSQYSPLNPVLSIYEFYFKEIEEEKEMQRAWEEANEEDLDESVNFERGLDPMRSMDIGMFHFDVEFSGDIEDMEEDEKRMAKKWNYKGIKIVHVEGNADEDSSELFFKLSDGDEIIFKQKSYMGPSRPDRPDYAKISISSLDINDFEVHNDWLDELSNGSIILATMRMYEDLKEQSLKESFERGINPKASMKIGIPTWETLREGDLVLVPKKVGLKKDYSIISRDTYNISEKDAVADLPEGTIMFVRELDNLSTKEWTLWYAYFSSLQDYKNNKDEINFSDRKGYINGTPKQFKEKFKLLPRNVSEAQQFQRGIDPKSTMNIGKRALIENWLKENDLFEDAVINKDLIIDIPAKANLAVHLNKKGWEGFPEYIQFGKVHGGFDISDNKFTSLRGCPTHVYETENLKGSFKCFNNLLKTLEGSPKRVDGVYICHTNPGEFQRKDVNAVCRVKSKQIWGDDRMKALKEAMEFQRGEDPLKSMDMGFHAQIRNWFKSCLISDDVLEDHEHYVDYRINKDGTIDVLEDINLVGAHIENFPYFIRFNRIYGSFYVANNIFTSLDGFPKEVDGDLSIYSDQKGSKKWKENEIRKVVKVRGTIWN